jgi:hypothetical protein
MVETVLLAAEEAVPVVVRGVAVDEVAAVGRSRLPEFPL